MKKEIFNEEVAAQIAGALLGAQAVQLKSEAPYFVWASGWHSSQPRQASVMDLP